MALEIIGDKTTIVFGYHDVLIGVKMEKDKGFLRLAHYPAGIQTKGGAISMEDDEFFTLEELSLLRFDSVESLDILLDELNVLKQNMLLNKLDELLQDVKSRTEFPTDK